MALLTDKVAVVTGASRGVGAATARLLAAEGARVVLCARRRGELEQAAHTLDPDGSRCLIAPADVGTLDGMKGLVDAALGRFGRIDLFINNAGAGVRKPIEETTEGEWDLMFAVNVKAVFRSLRELIPVMRRQGGGHIINVSSMASTAGQPTLGPYAASKAALNLLTESAGEELRNDNIKVSLVMPGSIATNFLARVAADRNPSPAAKPRLTPEQVAAMIVAIAAQDAGVWTSRVHKRPLRTK